MSMRISGLASGMDIDSLVKSMMQPAQIRIDKVLQQKTKGEWLQEAYHELNASLARFVMDRRQDFGLTVTSSSGIAFSRSVSNLDWVKTAVSSDAAVASVTANATAVDSSFTVKVERLAENWSAASVAALPEPVVTADSTGESLASQFGLSSTSVVDFTLTTASGKLRISSDPSAVAAEGERLIRIDLQSTSLASLASSINGANLGMKASYDAGIRRFFLQTANSGSENTLRITDTSSGLGGGVDGFLASSGGSSLLGLSSKSGSVVAGVTYSGLDALLNIGPATGILQKSNEFSINGVSYSLRQTGEFMVQVSTDVKTASEKIRSFVDKYNELIDKLNEKLSEKYDRNYQPLTDEQREAMSDDQVKKWEERAKTGLLAKSSELSLLVSNMRIGMTSQVSTDSAYSSLDVIGISTAPYSTDGKLVIDETKLRMALQTDANGVLQVLFNSPDSSVTDKAEQRKQSGVVNRLFSDVIDGMKSIINKAGTGDNASLYRSVQTTILLDFVTTQNSRSMIDEEIVRHNRTLLSLNDRFSATETRYYNQFTAMERAIEQANRQSAWLSQQFSSMSSR